MSAPITTTGAGERHDHCRCSRSHLLVRTRAVGAGDHRARVGDRLAGCDGGEHRPAGHRPRFSHRYCRPAVGDDRLHPDARRVPADRRLARRPLRQAEGLPDRHRVVRAGLGGVRARPHRAVPHHHPVAPGCRRGAAHTGKPGDPGSVVRACRPGPGDRGTVGPGWCGCRRRAAGRRLSDLGRVLAVDLLYQRPRRGGGGRAGRTARPRVA